MVYDCFTYFNEDKLLKYRLDYLKDIVDQFIIVEGNKTFQGNPKTYNLNLTELSNFPITYIKVDLSSTPRFSFQNEFKQRNAIEEGLDKAHSNDIILIGDVDEIPAKELIFGVDKAHTILEDYYKYDSNHRVFNKHTGEAEKWPGTVLLPFKLLTSPQTIRDERFLNPKLEGGWHYSWFGGFEEVKYKLKATAHTDLDIPENYDQERFYRLITQGVDPLDEDKVLKWKPNFRF